MAISGAAVSPIMGDNPMGFARRVLSIANLRLNYWLYVPEESPSVEKTSSKKPVEIRSPGLFYLWKEYWGKLRTDWPHKYLSDGGHFENLGIYSLIQRRCKFIIAIDGEADPEMTRGAINKLTRLVRQDFGVELDIETSQLGLNKEGFSASHLAFGTIHYPRNFDASGVTRKAIDDINLNQSDKGYILYLKSSLTGNEPNDVLDYRRRNKRFPHQSTADQLFTEEQFEAYRTLGLHIGDEIFSEELAKNLQKISKNEKDLDMDMEDLFSVLAERLLRSEIA